MPTGSKQPPTSKRSISDSEPQEIDTNTSTATDAGKERHALFPPGTKRSRNSIARQACETCRAKKLRCDEEYPCGLCRSLRVECQYAERKLTTTESTLETILQVLKRIEGKVDKNNGLSSEKVSSPTAFQNTIASPVNLQNIAALKSPGDQFGPPKLTPSTTGGEESGGETVKLSFSVHQSQYWPLIQKSLPLNVQGMLQELKPYYWLAKESDRQSLSPAISPSLARGGHDWLSQLPLSIVTHLSQAYFMVFNLIFPIIEEEAFFSDTLRRASEDGFAFDVHTCLVMMVLALGCLAIQAFQEGGYAEFLESHGLFDPRISSDPTSDNEILRSLLQEDPPGLSFFNEGRKRAGFFICESSVWTSQYNLLAALYFSQILRPVDAWIMTHRACVLLQLFWNGHSKLLDGNFPDLWARLYWIALMFEAVMGDELNLPPTSLSRFENKVPIPRFDDGPSAEQLPGVPGASVRDRSYFKYHFLAQVAHRLIVSRLRDALYINSTTGANPNTRLISELDYQIDQWKGNLPHQLQLDDDDNFSIPNTSPAHILASSWLYARFFIAKYHVRRPYLFKALHAPENLEPDDLVSCAEAFVLALKWWRAMSTGICLGSALPYKFGLCSQLLGHLTFGYIFQNSPDSRLRNCIPKEWTKYRESALAFMATCAPHSPAAAADLGLLVAMFASTDESPHAQPARLNRGSFSGR